jgi:hypothetical protein
MSAAAAMHGSLRALVACVALLGCSGAEWQNVEVAPRYQRPRHLNVTVIASTTGEDLRELLQEFAMMLHDELKRHAIDATIASETAAPPRAEIDITEWDPGSQADRYLRGFGAGKGHIVVVVNVMGTDGTPALQGQVRAYVSGGLFGGSSMDAARAAARSIASAIDKVKPN